MSRLTLLLVGTLVLSLGAPSASAQNFPEPRVIVGGLDFPVGIDFLEDGTMLVTERAGALRVVRQGELVKEPLATIPTSTSGETGLLGIAVSPDDDSAFVFATEPDGSSNTIWRVPLDGGEPARVIEGLPAATYHNGGGVAFDLDGALLVSNGEQHSVDRAQDPLVLGGKVYRFEADGAIPSDNPYEGSPTFAFGLRNPFGLAVDPETGSPWVTENGPSSFDEVNRIVSGGNYGWPEVSGPGEGSGLPGRYQDPVLAYEQIIVPTGLAFAGEGAPTAIAGDLFFGTFGERTVHHVRLNDARTSAVSDEVIHAGDQVVGMAWGPEGLYLSTPGSVKLIPLADGAGAGDTVPEAEEPRSSPELSPRGEPLTSDDGGPSGWLGLVVLVALGGAFVLLRRRWERS